MRAQPALTSVRCPPRFPAFGSRSSQRIASTLECRAPVRSRRSRSRGSRTQAPGLHQPRPASLELSFIGDIEVFQLFGPPGIFTEQFRTFYATQRVW